MEPKACMMARPQLHASSSLNSSPRTLPPTPSGHPAAHGPNSIHFEIRPRVAPWPDP